MLKGQLGLLDVGPWPQDLHLSKPWPLPRKLPKMGERLEELDHDSLQE